MKTPLTSDRLRALLEYDLTTGNFTNLITRHHAAIAGKLAGSRTNTGYVEIGIDGRRYLAHRLAWLWMTGQWPSGVIDHLDGNQANNVWLNLRDVTSRVNSQNVRGATAASTTGLLGAYRCGKRFKASIKLSSGLKHIGYFATAQAAHEAYLSEKRRLHEGCTI